MELILGIVVVVMAVYFIYNRFISNVDNEDARVKEKEKLPYRVTNSILTDAERSFYHILKLCVGDRAVICPKVGLKDFFFVSKGVGKDYMKYFGKIAKKHVDFLLCENGTMRPLCGIELDDFSHTSKKSQLRDLFVEKVYKDASFELIRISTKSGYTNTEIETALTGVFDKKDYIEEVPEEQQSNDALSNDESITCPKCNLPMILRKSSKGKNAGNEFYGCANYPKCKEIINKGV